MPEHEDPSLKQFLSSRKPCLEMQLGDVNTERGNILFTPSIESLISKGEVWKMSYSPLALLNYNRRKNMRPFLCAVVDDDVLPENVFLYIENNYGGYSDGSQYAEFITVSLTQTKKRVDIMSPSVKTFDSDIGSLSHNQSCLQVNVLLIELTGTSRTIKSCMGLKRDPKVIIMVTNPSSKLKLGDKVVESNIGSSGFYKTWTAPFIIRGGSEAQRKRKHKPVTSTDVCKKPRIPKGMEIDNILMTLIDKMDGLCDRIKRIEEMLK